jgi:hypothetical protein
MIHFRDHFEKKRVEKHECLLSQNIFLFKIIVFSSKSLGEI